MFVIELALVENLKYYDSKGSGYYKPHGGTRGCKASYGPG